MRSGLALIGALVLLAGCQSGSSVEGPERVAASFMASVRPAALASPSQMAGQWRLSDAMGNQCFVTLLGFGGSYANEVMQHGLCPGDLDLIAGWFGRGGEVVLTDGRGRPVGRVEALGPDVLAGSVSGRFGPVPVRLERMG